MGREEEERRRVRKGQREANERERRKREISKLEKE